MKKLKPQLLAGLMMLVTVHSIGSDHIWLGVIYLIFGIGNILNGLDRAIEDAITKRLEEFKLKDGP